MTCHVLHICILACVAVLSVPCTALAIDLTGLDTERRARDTKPFYLRIAPYGASITNGYLSTDGNGYRKHLRDSLRSEGWPVNMVGSLKTGSMKDNDNEGHRGWTIAQVRDDAMEGIANSQPNLVLINVGTNDAIQNKVDGAADEYIELLDKLWEEIPGATVILSTLLPNKNDTTNERAGKINDEIRYTVMDHYDGQKKKLQLAEMDDGFITTADLNDTTHPTDEGYKKMASVWLDAFHKVEKAQWLTKPPNVAGVDD